MFKLIVIVSFVLFGMANGGILIYGTSVDEKFPNMCYLSHLKMYIPKGGKAQNPNYCEEINCNDKLELVGASCGVAGYDKKTCVKLPEDLSKPYPYCCSQIKCNTNSNVARN